LVIIDPISSYIGKTDSHAVMRDGKHDAIPG
jgi:hypothetical protein